MVNRTLQSKLTIDQHESY